MKEKEISEREYLIFCLGRDMFGNSDEVANDDAYRICSGYVNIFYYSTEAYNNSQSQLQNLYDFMNRITKGVIKL